MKIPRLRNQTDWLQEKKGRERRKYLAPIVKSKMTRFDRRFPTLLYFLSLSRALFSMLATGNASVPTTCRSDAIGQHTRSDETCCHSVEFLLFVDPVDPVVVVVLFNIQLEGLGGWKVSLLVPLVVATKLRGKR